MRHSCSEFTVLSVVRLKVRLALDETHVATNSLQIRLRFQDSYLYAAFKININWNLSLTPFDDCVD